MLPAQALTNAPEVRPWASQGELVGVRARRSAEADLPALYDHHFLPLLRLARVFVDEVESAEEIVQDAFVAYLRHKHRVKVGSEAAYLRASVVNGCRSMLRKRMVRRRYGEEAYMRPEFDEDESNRTVERQSVIGSLRDLPSRQAAVLTLRYYFDLSEQEIADTLGISTGAVKSHAHRGLKGLASSLGSSR